MFGPTGISCKPLNHMVIGQNSELENCDYGWPIGNGFSQLSFRKLVALCGTIGKFYFSASKVILGV